MHIFGYLYEDYEDARSLEHKMDKIVKKDGQKEHFFSTSFYIEHLLINFSLETRHSDGDEKKLSSKPERFYLHIQLPNERLLSFEIQPKTATFDI